MELTHDRAEGYFFIRSCERERITVVDRELRRSFLIAPDRIVENWKVFTTSKIDTPEIEAILALAPALVLIGTGDNQELLTAQQTAAFLTRGIGVEAMSNAAASRTYNLLAGEGRRVVAAFILGDGDR